MTRSRVHEKSWRWTTTEANLPVSLLEWLCPCRHIARRINIEFYNDVIPHHILVAGRRASVLATRKTTEIAFKPSCLMRDLMNFSADMRQTKRLHMPTEPVRIETQNLCGRRRRCRKNKLSQTEFSFGHVQVPWMHLTSKKQFSSSHVTWTVYEPSLVTTFQPVSRKWMIYIRANGIRCHSNERRPRDQNELIYVSCWGCFNAISFISCSQSRLLRRKKECAQVIFV